MSSTTTILRDPASGLLVGAGGEPLRLYHGTGFDGILDPEALREGLHLGAFDQAVVAARRVPQRERRRILAFHLAVSRVQRLRDTTGMWKDRVLRARRGGYDAIVYLNRYEGMTTETVERAHQCGVDLDRLGDVEFQKYAPEAKDSFVALWRHQLVPVALTPEETSVFEALRAPRTPACPPPREDGPSFGSDR